MRGAAAATRILSKGACSGKSATSVAENHVHVRVPQPPQNLARLLRQIRLTLDRPDLAGQFSENCGFVAGACTYLENAILGTQFELLQHGSDDVRLRDRLPGPDG